MLGSVACAVIITSGNNNTKMRLKVKENGTKLSRRSSCQHRHPPPPLSLSLSLYDSENERKMGVAVGALVCELVYRHVHYVNGRSVGQSVGRSVGH